ncbi:MAG: hypothetical protein LBH44_04060, partial [Treponema sp.]|nr:hypothetical protein [Treponema sp.]
MNKPFCIAFFLLLCPFVFPPALETAGGHRGAITALIRSDDKIISAGEDGFIVIWDTQKRAASERFQLTPYGIKSLIKHPTRDEICIIESGGMDYSILSVWNYSSRKRLFSLQSGEEITFVNYSAGGSFIITANLDGSYLTLLNSQTGEVTSSPELTEPALFAMTGRAERNMLVYQSKYIRSFASGEYEGMIAYLDLNSASVTGEFNAPGGLASPIVFGNNRFLAGINREGLLLVDAASGTVLDKMKNISQDAILCPADTGFYCVTQEKDGWLFLQLAVDQRG